MGLVEWYVRSTIHTYMYDHQEARPRGAELKEAYTTRQMEMHIRRTNLFFFPISIWQLNVAGFTWLL